ncbi:murein hydrolase activator EnvC [Egicoccus sp. AB-alg6-2]|uniref:murein hydrolase activator EnvC family protein n=1 Tax=Egicoccus sp. AB-alg6-2 TaxID=3242692 RepID=UPI00359EC47E
MRSRSLRALAMAAAFALMASLVPTVAGAQQAEQRQLEEARARLAELGRELERAEDRAQEADAELEDADARLAEVEAVVNEVAAAVERQRGAVREAEHRLAEVEEEAAQVAAAFAERAARMFKEGPSVPFQLLLDSEGAEDAMSRTSYLRVITQADRVTIESLEAADVAVTAERERLAAEQQRLEAMLAEQEELLAEVERLRESRALAAAAARDDLRRLESEHDDLEQESVELEALIREQQEAARRQAAASRRAAATASAPAASGGGSATGSSGGSASVSAPSSSGFAWPLCAPVTSEFGPRWGRMHNGIDQGASTGTAIGASKAGTVIFAGWQGGYGNLTLIDHHDGVVTAYAHQSSISVSRGQSVSQGQRIGAVGSTGNSTGPHLHFETRVNGSAVNPRQYLPGSPC